MIGALAFAIEHFVTVLTALRLRWAHAAIVSAPSEPILAAWAVLASTAAALALVASVLVVKVAPPATGAGVALVMASLNGVHVPKLLSLRTAVVKVVGTVCSVASGLPVGPEGPLVHVGACVASLFTRQHRLARKVPESGRIRAWLDTFFNDRDGRDFLSAGVASGLAAAFGAPIGGVLFSLEEASTHWSHDTTWRYVVPSTTSSHPPRRPIHHVAPSTTSPHSPRRPIHHNCRPIYSRTPDRSLLCSTLSIFTLSLLRSRADGVSAESVYSVRAPGLISFGGSHGDGGPGEVDFYLWELPAFVALSACAGAIGALVTRGTSALSRIRTKVSTSSTTRAAEAVAVAALCATCAVAAATFAGECRSTAATGRDASVAVRLGCGEGEYNDLAALLLGLRDDVIVDLLSAGESYSPAPTPPSVGDGPPRASRERPLTFSARSVAIGLGLTLATMTLASDLSLPAGVFMPTILWGGLLGSLFGELVRYAATETDVRPGGYAIVGSTAALAGVFRGSISLVVIMLEGTGRMGYLLPLLVGVAVANLAGAGIGAIIGCDGSFYDQQLAAARVPFLRHHGAPTTAGDVQSPPHSRAGATVAEVMSRDPVCLDRVESVARIVSVLRSDSHNGYPVVEAAVGRGSGSPTGSTFRKGRVVGLILRSQLMVLLARRAFVEVVPPAPALAPDQSSARGRRLRGFVDVFRRERAAAAAAGPGSQEVPGSEEISVAANPGGGGGGSVLGVEELRTYYDALDADMRTFHHRHSHGDRTVAVSTAALERIGLTDRELAAFHCDVGAFMKIAPLTVNERCSVWRAADYLVDVGLRHLPVVDDGNEVVGMLTRGDLCGQSARGDGE